MALSNEELVALLAAPREALDIELKRWLDPSSDEGKSKIAKGCLALWNSGGGLFVLGFDDKTCLPDRDNVPADVRGMFNADVVQRIVGEFAAQPFPVEVLFVEREGQAYPIISVPSGVRTPVAAKRDLSVGGKPAIRDHVVYVRSLSSNNTVSSSEPRRGDWERIVSVWFDNREADIGSFVRRQLGGLDLPQLRALIEPPAPAPTAVERATDLLSRGRVRFSSAMEQRKMRIPAVGLRETAIVIEGNVPEQAPSASFLQRLSMTKPRYSGWSPWVISQHSGQDIQYVYDGGWEALIAFSGNELFRGDLNFWRIDPRGEFYHLDALPDDFHQAHGISPGTQLDFRLQIVRVVEYITAAKSFALSMGCSEASTRLACAFRWSGLAGRTLVNRQDPSALYRQEHIVAQNEVITSVVVPLETSASALAPYVQRAVAGLFLVFGGRVFEDSVIESRVREALQTRY